MKRIGIVGLGLIGKERVRAIEILQKRNLPISLCAVYDPYQKDIQTLASDSKVCSSLEDMVAQSPDLVVVALPHDAAVTTTQKLLAANIKVLLEKPMGRSLIEANQIANSCLQPSQLLIAHNYRFFAGVATLLRDIKTQRFGQPIGFSLLLGHGGSPEDRNSWKLHKEKAGGGALIDPGIHLIDLCNLLCKELRFTGGAVWNGFWKTGIEEECRMLLASETIPMIDITTSVVRWRSTFRLEFFGESGYGIVTGRGKSYGAQEYRIGQRWGWQAAASQAESEELVLTSSCDQVFADELESILFSASADSIKHACTVEESLDNMKVLDDCRRQLKLG